LFTDYPDSRDARLIPHPFCILDEWRRAVCCLQQHYNHINKPTKTVRYVPSNGRFPDINPVLSSHGVQHCLSDDTMQDMLKKYTDASRRTIAMPEKIHFHMLRKTRAMDLYQAGCPLSYIQQLLGHESISTTSGFYAFATLKTLADAIEKANPSGSEEKLWKDETVLKQLYRL